MKKKIMQLPFDSQEPDHGHGRSGHHSEQGRGVEAEVDHVADFRRRVVEVSEGDRDDEDEGADV